MNKKAAAWIQKLVSITLILIVLFILYLFLPGKILNTGKEFFNKIWGQEELVIDYTEIDDTAQKSFDVMIKEINKCSRTKTSPPCLCSVNLNAFYSFYAFYLWEDKIEMHNVKGEGKGLFVKEGKTPKTQCYISHKKWKDEPTIELNFESQGRPYILLKKKFIIDGLQGDEKLYINPTTHNLIKISDSEICWVLEQPKSKLPEDIKACAI